MIVLRPTESELHLGMHVGVLRAIFALRAELEGKYGCEDTGCAAHINGAIGEMMLAKHRNLFWTGTVGTVRASADVGGYLQVRATELRHGKLIAHPPDKDYQPFVLARILLPEVHLVGWLWGGEAKQKKFWRDDVARPAFFAWPVRDMETLPDEVAVRARQAQSA
jgi:hypothetical protein